MWIATIAGKQLLAEQSHFSDNGVKSFLKLQASFDIPLFLLVFLETFIKGNYFKQQNFTVIIAC